MIAKKSRPLQWLAVVVGAASAAQLTIPTAQAQDRPSHYAIENARLVTVSGQTIDRGTIVIENGVITQVGGGSRVTVPAGAWVIDGNGLTVYPGLIDALTTLGLPRPPAREARRGGGGPPRGGRPGGFPGGGGGGPIQIDPNYSYGPEDRPATFTWVNAADQLEPDSAQVVRWRSAGFTSVVVAPDQGFFPGHAALINLAGERPRDMVVKTPVALRANLRGGRGHRGYPSSTMGSFAYIKQLFADAAHYQAAWELYERNPRGLERPEYDRALEPLAAIRNGSEKLLFPANTTTDMHRAFHTSEEIGATTILYGMSHGYEAAPMLAMHDQPVLVSLNWPTAPRDADPEADTSLEELRFRLLAPTTPAVLQEAGVTFAFYSDTIRNPSEVLAGARKAVEAGLAHDDAVRAFTLSAAEIFGVADRLGSLDVGKIANLVVTDGDLLDDSTKVQFVFVDGQRFEPEEDTGGRAGGQAGRRAGGLDGAGERAGRRAGGQGEEGGQEGEEGEEGPSDTELRSRIGGSLRGPYRDDDVTLIRNATIMTVTNGTIENGSILIRNGKIAEIGTDISTPRGAHVIDATGQYVIPGIIDAHSHIAGGSNEGSVAVSAMVGIKDVVNPDDIGIYRGLAGGVTTANVLHGSANPIGGKNAVIKLRWGADAQGLLLEGAPEGIKFALGENPTRDRNPDRYPATRMGVMDVIRQAFLDAQAYQAEWDEYEAKQVRGENAIPPRRDLKHETMAEVLRGERLVHAHSYRGDEILQLIRLAEEFGFRIATFQHVLEGYKVAKELAEHGAGASTFSDWWAYKVEAYDAIPYNAAIMVEKGVLVSINSDSGEEMRHLNQEAAKTVKWGGLSETEALSLITINPARQLGIDHLVGSIEVGKDADLTIYDGHPLSNYAVVQKTIVDGKVYFDRELDKERQRRIQEEKEALSQKGRPRVTTDGADRTGRRAGGQAGWEMGEVSR